MLVPAAAAVWGLYQVKGGFDGDGWNALMAAGIAFIGFAWKLSYAEVKDHKNKHKAHVVGRLATFLGLYYWPDGHKDMIDRHARLSLLPAHDRSSCEDGFSGKEQGLKYRMTEVHLERRVKNDDQRSGYRWVTVFRGMLVSIEVAKQFSSTTKVLRNSPAVFSVLHEALGSKTQVKLEDPQFEAVFDIYGDDQVEARYLLTPGMMERFMTLSHGHKNLVGAFAEGKLHLAFSKDDRFNAGNISSRLGSPSLAREVINDLLSVREFSKELSETAAVRV